LYRNDMNVFVDELERPEVKAARRHIPVSIGILTGLRRKYVPIKQVEEQVQAVRDRKFAGVSFFFYETLWNMTQEKPQKRQRGFLNIFSAPVKAPSLKEGWKPV
ncbi:MAG: glycoside hydrolase family 10 protein, partial [Cyanobacteria bacterium J06639_18]